MFDAPFRPVYFLWSPLCLARSRFGSPHFCAWSQPSPLSAKAGDPAAEFELANAFFAGKDIPKDESQGMALLERAARSGLPQAQFQMGERTYGDGNNSENYVAAYMWYALAQRSGFEKSESRVTELEGRMTPDQLAEAHKRVQDTPQN
jgi:TPR repeat protein